MAVNSIYELTVRYVNNEASTEFDNVLHYRAGGVTVFDTQAEDLIEAFRAFAEAELLAAISNQVLIRQYRVIGVTDPTEFAESSVLDLQGSQVGDVLPYQAAQTLIKRTGLRGRSFMGRMQLPPASESAQSDSRWTAGQLALMQAVGDSIIQVGGGVLTAVYALQVYSRTLLVGTPVTSVSVQGIVGGQQSRKPGRGI